MKATEPNQTLHLAAAAHKVDPGVMQPAVEAP